MSTAAETQTHTHCMTQLNFSAWWWRIFICYNINGLSNSSSPSTLHYSVSGDVTNCRQQICDKFLCTDFQTTLSLYINKISIENTKNITMLHFHLSKVFAYILHTTRLQRRPLCSKYVTVKSISSSLHPLLQLRFYCPFSNRWRLFSWNLRWTLQRKTRREIVTQQAISLYTFNNP